MTKKNEQQNFTDLLVCSCLNTIEKIQVEALGITTCGTKVCSPQKMNDDLSCETLEKCGYRHTPFILSR